MNMLPFQTMRECRPGTIFRGRNLWTQNHMHEVKVHSLLPLPLPARRLCILDTVHTRRDTPAPKLLPSDHLNIRTRRSSFPPGLVQVFDPAINLPPRLVAQTPPILEPAHSRPFITASPSLRVPVTPASSRRRNQCSKSQ